MNVTGSRGVARTVLFGVIFTTVKTCFESAGTSSA